MRGFEKGSVGAEMNSEAPVERGRSAWQRMGQKILNVVKDTSERLAERRFQKHIDQMRMQAEERYNGRLDTVKDLEEAVAVQEEGITKTTTEYEGRQIDVYNLMGKRFHFLQHSLEGLMGVDVARELRDNPSLWMKNKAEVQFDDQQRSDTLSVSYIDTNINVTRGGVVSKHGLVYGFSRIRPGALLRVFSQNGGTPNRTERVKNAPSEMATPPDRLAKQSTHSFNEILLKRYDEEGMPMRPDFLVARDGVITEDAKRHAAEFGVPIVNVETGSYIEQQKESLTAKLGQIGENSTYSEIAEMFVEAEESSLDIDSTWKEDIYDDYNGRIDLHYQEEFAKLPVEARIKMRDIIERIEPVKRLKVLDNELKNLIIETKKARKKGGSDAEKVMKLARVDGFKRETVDGEGILRAVDALKISYRYTTRDGGVKWINTVLKEPSTAYKHFSELAGKYEQLGGKVYDSRWNAKRA